MRQSFDPVAFRRGVFYCKKRGKCHFALTSSPSLKWEVATQVTAR